MKARRRFLIALMLSILLHASVVTAPGWLLPSLADRLRPKKSQPLDAWLQRPAKQAVAVPKPVKPRRAKPRPPAPNPNAVVVRNMPIPEAGAPQSPAVPEAPAPVAETSASPAAASASAEAAVQPPANPELLTKHVRIEYSVSMGKGGFVIGQLIEDIDNDGATYQMRTTTRTTGLARLFKPIDLVHTSVGDIVDGRLRPRLFTIERDGQSGERTLFDWEQGPQVWIGEHDYPLEPDTQDMLSVFCDLALIPITGTSVTLPVATGKKVERYQFAVIGEEQLATPMGEQPTLHLRTVGTEPQVTDVWLGLNFARLPIRIRHLDRNGEVFDQTAVNITALPPPEEDH